MTRRAETPTDALRPALAGATCRLGRALRHRIRTALLVAATLALACAASPRNAIAPGFAGAPGVEQVLLVPANLAVELRQELEDGAGPIDAEIAAYLGEQGRRVERLPLRDARRLWLAAVSEPAGDGEAEDFHAAAARFARALAETREFQALVMPTLFLQHVHVRHRSAAWDGVERRIRVVNAPRPRAGRNVSALVDGLLHASLHADLPVGSLRVMVFSRDGRQVFDGRGGLDFLDEVDFSDLLEHYRFELRRRSDLFQDRSVLREAVELAFAPYLPANGVPANGVPTNGVPTDGAAASR